MKVTSVRGLPVTSAMPKAVTAVVTPVGLVTLQLNLVVQLEAPRAISQEASEEVNVPVIAPVLVAEP